MVNTPSRFSSEAGFENLSPEFNVHYEDANLAVRPYTVTGGRVRGPQNYPVEALVAAIPGAQTRGLTPEKREIIRQTSSQYLSIAELSVHTALPIGVVRVVVADLVAEERVIVHGVSESDSSPAATMSVLESVLNGISAL